MKKKKCCQQTLDKVNALLGEEIKTAIAAGQSRVGVDPAVIINVVYRLRDKMKKLK